MLRHFAWMILAVSLLALASFAQAEDLTVAIDLDTAPSPDPSSIQSSYTGSGPTIYAFLVVSGIESVTGVLTGFSLDADSSLVNDGFTCLTPWVGAGLDSYGFYPEPGTAGRASPVALGYWTLRLTEGASSRGTLRLMAPGGVDGEAVLVLDGQHRALPALTVTHAAINTSVPDPTEHASVAEFLDQPEHHVLLKFRHDSLRLPPGTIGAPLESVTDMDSLMVVALDRYCPLRVDAVFPAATQAESLAITIDGLPVKLPDLWRIGKLTLPRESAVDSLIAQLDTLASITYAERNGYLTPEVDPSDTYYQNGDQW